VVPFAAMFWFQAVGPLLRALVGRADADPTRLRGLAAGSPH